MAELQPWHANSLDSICEQLDCALNGLSDDEAQRRLAEYGENRLPEPPPVPRWRIFLRQFLSPLIYILLVAAAVSLALGLLDDTIFIFGVLLLNAIIGYVQESKAERDIRSLGRMLVTRARVQRSGHTRDVDSSALVPGDVVWLESGTKVPVDLRLISAHGLRVDQSLHTGESLPVEKLPGGALPVETPPSDQSTMVFSGTTVFQGRAEGLVVGTGLNTQVGKIAQQLQHPTHAKPPLIVRMERFSRRIALLVLGLCAVIFAIGFVRGDVWSELLMSALALSVSAIPEGLPVALTVALSIGVHRMARRNVLVRHLEAVEALGSCSVIASDKTGTLTTNQLTAVAGTLAGQPITVTGAGFSRDGEIRAEHHVLTLEDHPVLRAYLRAGVLCNEATLNEDDGQLSFQGDPTDIALLVLGLKGDMPPGMTNQHYPRTNVIPFEPERRFAASFHELPQGRGLTVVKGAPEKVLGMCDTMWVSGQAEPVPLDGEQVSAWIEQLTAKGHRVLALAEREEAHALGPHVTPGEPAGMVLLGLVGMTDPPREGVAEAIGTCHRAGIRVVMVTGDHLNTAGTIANGIGLLRPGQHAIDGAAVETMSDEALVAQAPQFAVIGRATPTAKLRIVQALQANGDFVAVTGDGVNDAPALRMANIGVAMGRSGTDIARDASDLIITDDDFSSIVGGVEEGRVAYDNVRKVIYLLVSTGLGEVFAVLLAMLTGLPVPFLPAQLLWLNLVTNGVQDVALAFEPKEGGELERAPRPAQEGIFNRLMLERTVLAALVFGGVSFWLFSWLLAQGRPVDEARGLLLNLFVLFEILHLGNSRSETRSIFRISPFSNRVLFVGNLGAVLVHLAALKLPVMQGVLSATMPSWREWGLLLLLASSVVVVMELHKLTWRLRYPPAASRG